MKIISSDNFGREHISDKLVCENINKFYGEKIVEFLNKSFSGDYANNYYNLVEDNHKLYKFKP